MNHIAATFLIPILVSLTLSMGVLIYTWQRRSARGATALIWYMAGQGLWIFGYLFELLEPNLDGKLFWDKFEWIVGTWIVIALPVFVIQYTDTHIRKPRLLFGLSLMAPILLAGLLLTDGTYHWIYANPRILADSPFSELSYQFTPVAYAYAGYSFVVIGVSLFLLLRQNEHHQEIYRTQSLIIAAGVTIPLIGTSLTLTGLRLFFQRDLTPFTFALGNLVMAWGLYRHRLLEILPLGRDKVFESMVDPVVILDNQHRIVDINTSMLDLLGGSAADIIGQSAKQVFDDFPIPIKLYTHVSYARAETTFQVRGKNVYYEMTVWPLYDSNRKMMGRIYISHDITAFKELERELRDLNQRLEQRVYERTRELAEAYDTTLEGWAKALELRDKETEGHSRRVMELTLRLARAIEIPDDQIVHIRRGAILHDIGKMAISDEILLKPGRLTEQERLTIQKHPEIAYQLLSQISFLKKALDIPYCHHERWDGSGYPRGLKEREIPLAARIFALADVWDALSFDRPYNQAWPREKICRHILEQSGKQFDPYLVDVFLKMVERGEI